MPRTTKDHLRGKRVTTVEVREEAGNRQGKGKSNGKASGGETGRDRERERKTASWPKSNKMGRS